MTDLFAVLDEPRRPWLDPEALKAKFLQLSASLHPDRTHGATPSEKESAQRRFTELNTAYQCLHEPRHRLRHLLELEAGGPLGQVDEIPSSLMDTFLEIGALCRQSDAFLAKKNAVTSPLLQVGLFQQAQQWIERLSKIQKQISEQQNALLERLKIVDASWMKNRQDGIGHSKEVITELAELYRLLGYVHRWGAQVQERIVQLAF
jgi:DnaJ-domain-containing protein 1